MDHFGEMLGRMLDAARFTDICFYVDKRPIRAHKFVLATRSPFMKELLRTRYLHIRFYFAGYRQVPPKDVNFFFAGG
jgi:hypothetical protein